jgi:hypothetical protein
MQGFSTALEIMSAAPQTRPTGLMQLYFARAEIIHLMMLIMHL